MMECTGTAVEIRTECSKLFVIQLFDFTPLAL